jgi:hypothetical protein
MSFTTMFSHVRFLMRQCQHKHMPVSWFFPSEFFDRDTKDIPYTVDFLQIFPTGFFWSITQCIIANYLFAYRFQGRIYIMDNCLRGSVMQDKQLLTAFSTSFHQGTCPCTIPCTDVSFGILPFMSPLHVYIPKAIKTGYPFFILSHNSFYSSQWRRFDHEKKTEDGWTTRRCSGRVKECSGEQSRAQLTGASTFLGNMWKHKHRVSVAEVQVANTHRVIPSKTMEHCHLQWSILLPPE